MTQTIEQPLSNLKDGARDGFVLPALSWEGLMSIKVLADNGYTTIFHDKGISVHDNDSFQLTMHCPAMLQGWQNKDGLWMVPFTNKAHISSSIDAAEQAMNVYDLPSMGEIVCFLHAALGFPTKVPLLDAAKKVREIG